MPSTTVCPKCQRAMEKGYIADLSYGACMQSAWTPGEPVPRRFFAGIKWRRSDNTPIVTFRCTSCGYLESYAPRR
jgi:rubredoxin